MEKSFVSPHVREEGSVKGMIRTTCFALLPALIWSLYCYGWRLLTVIAVTVAAALATEVLVCRFLLRKAVSRDGSTLLSGILLAALLPPSVSLPVAALGGALAAGVKLAFGGLGRNPVNPALSAAGLLYIVFSKALTAYTAPFAKLSPFRPFFSGEEIERFTGDSAPLAQWKAGKMPTQSWYQLLSGDVPGALGAGSALLLLAGGLFLLVNRVIKVRVSLAFLLTVGSMALLQPLENGNMADAVGVALLSGGTMLGAFFLLTDPVTSPVTRWGGVCYGVIAGLFTALFRSLTGDIFAMVYAILIANLLSRPLDYLFRPRPYGGRPLQQFGSFR